MRHRDGRASRPGAHRRRAVVVLSSLAGALAVVTASAVPAGALPGTGNQPPANNLIVGTGAQANYNLSQSLDTLFNDAPGCQLTESVSGTPEPLDYECTDPVTEGSPTLTPQQNAGYTENPINDVSVEEPAIGSGSGVIQLTLQQTTTEPVAENDNYVRSSSSIAALGTTAVGGLNFVAFADDGLSWFHFTTVGGSNSSSQSVTNLTKAQLVGIYNGTIDNWSQLGGANAPIIVYSAPEGSGLQKTFALWLGFDPSKATNPVNCAVAGSGGLAGTQCAGPEIVFQDEDAQIGTTPEVNGSQLTVGGVNFGNSANGSENVTALQSDSAFYFSVGYYGVTCGKGGKKKTASDCGGSPLPSGTANALGQISGATPNEASILEGTWPIERQVFNVYSNGFGSFPEATPATLNYVSEAGFICKPQTLDQSNDNLPKKVTQTTSNTIEDPNTGLWYEDEIQTAIEAAGFYPITGGASQGKVTDVPVDEGSVDHGAMSLLAATNGVSGTGYGEIWQNQPISPPGNSAGYQLTDLHLDYATADNAVVPAGGPGTPGHPLGFCEVTSTS